MVGGDVEIIHCPRQVEIAVGIEPLDKRRALIAQVALDLEIRVERKRRQFAVLHPPPELAVQRGVGEIGDMSRHPGHREPAMRMSTPLEVAPVMPIRIGHHRLPAEFVKRDVLRGVPRAAGDRHHREHAVRISRGPLQRLHASHRAADDAQQRFDAETIEQHRLRPHHVRYRDDRKIQSPHLAGGGIGRGRTGRAHAAADHIRADDEVSVGIERPASTDHDFPPAGFTGQWMQVGDVLIQRQRMADHDRVGAFGVELAVGLVGDLERRQIDAAIELQRLVHAELRQLRRRMVRFMGAIVAVDRGTGYRLQICHLGTGLPERGLSNRNQAIKNPA